MDSETLEKKAVQIQKQLEKWLLKHPLYHPGERIIFSIRMRWSPVESDVPHVSLDTVDMHARFFFTKERLIECGASKAIAGRIHSMILKQFAPWETVRDFIEKYPTESSLLQIRKIGKSSIPYIQKALETLY